uniref:Immunoglobulin domain-containing protein n=1 Tax=Cyprinus carpio TaxID=7962 RepID=A0A8C2KG45_CYPCA
VTAVLYYLLRSCCGTSEEQTAYLRGTAVIRCKYPEKYNSGIMQLFKLQNGSLQPFFTLGGAIDPRFSLYENKQEQVFTVTIVNISRHDAGVYFCGAHVTNDPTKISYKYIVCYPLQMVMSECSHHTQQKY